MADDQNFANIIRVLNSRKGYGTMFARDGTVITKEMIELHASQEWARSLQNEFGICITDIKPSGASHPDCTANYNSKEIGIELTELIDGNILHRLMKHTIAPHDVFEQTQWDEIRFQTCINEIIEIKSEKYRKSRYDLDVLIIHTDETWLSPHSIQDWLETIGVSSADNIRSVFFLRSYFPGYRDWWPIFPLYGSIGGTTLTANAAP